MGYQAGNTTQGSNGVAIGYQAGFTAQGANAVAIGYLAAPTSQGANSIVINATNAAVAGTTPSATYIAPIRTVATSSAAYALSYETTSNEVYYNSGILNAGSLQSGVATFSSTVAVGSNLTVAGTTTIGLTGSALTQVRKVTGVTQFLPASTATVFSVTDGNVSGTSVVLVNLVSSTGTISQVTQFYVNETSPLSLPTSFNIYYNNTSLVGQTVTFNYVVIN